MKYAFTMLELVLVVVVIGIISAVMVPRINNTQIDKAAQQIINHMRYTQHLAMMDNQFDPDDPDWYKKRWQIRFQYTGSSPRKQYYTIYSDKDTNDNYAQNEIAKNPLNPRQYLTGDKTYNTKVITKEMNLYDTYKIKGVSFLGCVAGGVSNSQRIAFDYVGRPIVKNLYALDNVYNNGNEDRLVDRACTLKITDTNNQKIYIAIEPETGYVHLSKIERN